MPCAFTQESVVTKGSNCLQKRKVSVMDYLVLSNSYHFSNFNARST